MSTTEDSSLLRYSRHILLPQIGTSGQERLASATVLIVGLGGLGSPAAIYLAGSGVKRLVLFDDDEVELSNLQRQILHTTNSIGKKKTDSAAKYLKQLNPAVEVITYALKADATNLIAAVKEADVVIDASDNFATRYAINAVCWKYGKPLVSGAAIRCEAQLSVFVPSDPDSPCYQCLYPPGKTTDDACVNNGVLSPLTGVVGAMQAIETIKLVAGFGKPLKGRVLLFDAVAMQWNEIQLKKDPQCDICK